jgi:nicotinamidase/pyrazinamidase
MKRLLIVVDYQKDFVDGPLGFAKAAELEELIAEKILEYRKAGDEIVFTFDTHAENYLDTQEGKNLPVVHCMEGSAGHALYGRVAELITEGDMRFNKPAFGSAELYEYVKDREYAAIELAGIISNICVISNAVLVKTAAPETPVLVDAMCIASNDDKLNEAAVAVMESLQIKIQNR